MNDPRKHHYVPIVYQNNFVNAEGLLWVYDRKLQTYKELHPRKICCEKDLYSIRPEGKPKDQRLESDALAGMDGVCATAIRQIVAGVGKLPARSTIEVIAQFVGLQYSRAPSMREFVTSSWEAHTKESMRLRAVNEDRMQSTIDRYVEETGETIEASAKTMVEVVRRGGLKVVVTEVPFLRHIFSTGQMVSQTVMQTSWQVLIASPDSGFISCDHPVAVIPAQQSSRVGFFVPGTVTYVPLTRRVCLRLSGRDRTFRYRPVDQQTVRVINQNIAANSDRFILSPVKEQLESIVACSGSQQMDGRRFTFEFIKQTDDESIHVLSNNPRRYFYLNNGQIAP